MKIRNYMIPSLLAAVIFCVCATVGVAGEVAVDGLDISARDLRAREVFPQLGHSADISSISFSPDGSLILSGSWDRTVRLWDANTGREIAQFISFTDGEWVVITSDGFYNASPNGDRHINVRTENGVFGMEQYREIYFRPDIIEARLRGGTPNENP